MIVEFEGRTWELDPSKLRLQQGYVIQAFTGMSVGDWQDSLDFKTGKDADGNDVLLNPPPEWLKSIAALYWLMLSQNGIKTPIDEADCEVETFLAAFVQAMMAELEKRKAEAQPDPTPPSPTTPSPPAVPPSPVPAIPTVTTPTHPVLQGGGLVIAST